MKMRYVTYICSKCGAQDSDKLFDHENPLLAINCWKCGAGKGKDLNEMLGTNVGMFPKGRAA
jgi:ribosomal protein L40E